MKIDLLTFFEQVKNEHYVVIKPSNKLPDYDTGSDIDIFCYDTHAMVEKVTEFLTSYIDDKSSIAVTDSSSKCHIDFMVNNQINIRFDLYKELPHYSNIDLKPAWFSSVIESAVEQKLSIEDITTIVKVPSVIDDLILRYVEYHEYYAARPDKIKHIEYIQNKIDNKESDYMKMLDKLHFYTEFPQVVYKDKTFKDKLIEKHDYYLSNFDKVKHLYSTVGLRGVFRKVAQKIRT